MLKKLLPAVAAFCLLALSLGTALAHEPREIEDYNLVVGFLNEPASEGIMNGVYVHVTKVAEHGHGEEPADEMSKDEDESHEERRIPRRKRRRKKESTVTAESSSPA